MASCISHTCTLYTDQVSIYIYFSNAVNVCLNAISVNTLIHCEFCVFYYLSLPSFSQWAISWMCTWTPVDRCRPWREIGFPWTAQPLGSWTPESTSPGTTLERSGPFSGSHIVRNSLYHCFLTIARVSSLWVNSPKIRKASLFLFSSKHVEDTAKHRQEAKIEHFCGRL